MKTLVSKCVSIAPVTEIDTCAIVRWCRCLYCTPRSKCQTCGWLARVGHFLFPASEEAMAAWILSYKAETSQHLLTSLCTVGIEVGFRIILAQAPRICWKGTGDASVGKVLAILHVVAGRSMSTDLVYSRALTLTHTRVFSRLWSIVFLHRFSAVCTTGSCRGALYHT